jgi:hypothetical protein
LLATFFLPASLNLRKFRSIRCNFNELGVLPVLRYVNHSLSRLITGTNISELLACWQGEKRNILRNLT